MPIDERIDESGGCFACNADISHAAGGDGYRIYRQADGKPQGETDGEVELCENCRNQAVEELIIQPESDVLGAVEFDCLSAWIQAERRYNGLNGLSDQVEAISSEVTIMGDALRAIKQEVLEFHRACERDEYTDVGVTWEVFENVLRLAQRALGQDEPKGFDEGKEAA